MNIRIATAVKSSLLAALLGLSLQAHAQTQVQDAWVRATVPGQPATGAFMHLTSSTDARLVGVASPVAKMVQIHQSSMKDDVMNMQKVDAVELPAGKMVVFDTEGYHVMLMGLNAQVKEGDQVPLTLTVEDASGSTENLEVMAPARALTTDAHSAHGAHAGH